MVEHRQLLPSPPMRPGRCDFPEDCLWKSQGGEKYGGKDAVLLPSLTSAFTPPQISGSSISLVPGVRINIIKSDCFDLFFLKLYLFIEFVCVCRGFVR